MLTHALITFFAAATLSAAGLYPQRLEVESQYNPVGVGSPRPVFSWKLASDAQGDSQAGYRILAATSPALLFPGKADLMDTGPVESAQTLGIEYTGTPLRSNQKFYWTVGVRSSLGGEWAYTGAAHATMALLDPKDFKAGWIAVRGKALTPGPMPLFRREFNSPDAPVRAILHVSGLGAHEVHINGQRVGDRVLSPAWSDYRKRVYYESFDVSAMLRQGPNAIGVMLGNGFFNVPGGRYAKFTGSFGPPKLWLQLHLFYPDGSEQLIVSNTQWKSAPGPIRFSCIYGGEDYDARQESAGWDRSGFDDSAWQNAEGQEPAGGVMEAMSSPPLKVMQRFSTVRITTPKSGVAIHDLGQNFSGWPRLRVHGPAGATVRMIPGELLDANGLVTQRSSGGPTYFEYTLKGGAAEEWAPRFSYTGLRYVQVETTGSPTIDSIEGEFVHSSATRIGSFVTSSDLLNRIHALIDAAVRSNLQHVITDCPHREKLGWLEQIHLMGPSILYNYDLRTLLPKILRDMQDAQLRSGLVPDIAPEYVIFQRGFRDSPEWGSSSIQGPWLQYLWHGDRRALTAYTDMMESYNAHLRSTASPDGIVSHGLGDWYDIGPGAPGESKLTPRGITATAFYIDNQRLMARMCRAHGDQQCADTFDARVRDLKAAFHAKFFDEAKRWYGSGSQTANAMPLVLNLAHESLRSRLAEVLAADVRAHGNHPTAGDVGHRFLLLALAQSGRSDVVWDMISHTEPPSYGAQLKAGATSLTEAWDANPNSSQNHFMLGHVEEWFYGYLAGIRPDESAPGFGLVRIEPQPVGDLTFVRASIESPRGRISSEWRREAGKFYLKLQTPPGVEALLKLPGSADVTRVKSGQSEWAVPLP